MTLTREWLREIDHVECCGIRRADEKGCKVILPGSCGEWLCLSGTKYQQAHKYDSKLCDLILFWDHPDGRKLVAAIEQKGGSFHVSRVHEQIQNGAGLAAELLGGVPVLFAPVLAHRGITTMQIRDLRRNRVRFGKRSPLIQIARCGVNVVEVDWPTVVV